MKIEIHVHVHHHAPSAEFVELRSLIHTFQENVMASQAELAANLTALKDQVVKSRTEVLKKIADLEEALANGGGTTPEVDAALAALRAEVQASDDIVPDAPTP